MNRIFKLAFLLLSLFSSVSIIAQTTYYVATNGNDKNKGTTLITPFATIAHAVKTVAPGDTIYVRSGVYTTNTTISITKSGTKTKHITLSAYKPDLTKAFNNNRPVLDYSVAFATASSSERGIELKADYWNVYGLVIDRAGDNGMWVSGHYCTINFCVFCHNRDGGLQLSGGASADSIINCDSYANADMGPGTNSNGGNADGFSIKMDIGDSIYMKGCRSWYNSDDGYDGYLRPSTTSPQNNVTWTQEDCWAWRNGWYWLNDSTNSSMNGQGFKTGGSDTKDLAHNCYMIRCLSFYNKANGFDQNSNAGTIALYNCTSWGNKGSSIYMASPNVTYYAGAQLVLENNLSLGGTVSTPNLTARPLTLATNQFSKSTTSTQIVSFDTTGVSGPRGLDGSLPNINFMHLNTAASQPFTFIDKGTVLSNVVYHDTLGVPYVGAAPDLGCFESNFIAMTTPIKLVSLSAIENKEGVYLQWNTASETNTFKCIIQHSEDGISFANIGSITSVGEGANSYSFTDKTPYSTFNYYRLQFIDKDGTSTFSKVVTIQLTTENDQLSIIPNPIRAIATVKGNHITSIQVIDNLGRVAKTIFFKDATNPTLSVNGLQAGAYHLRIQTTNGQARITKVVLK